MPLTFPVATAKKQIIHMPIMNEIIVLITSIKWMRFHFVRTCDISQFAFICYIVDTWSLYQYCRGNACFGICYSCKARRIKFFNAVALKQPELGGFLNPLLHRGPNKLNGFIEFNFQSINLHYAQYTTKHIKKRTHNELKTIKFKLGR